jgi:Family of unknown function (DUF6444)
MLELAQRFEELAERSERQVARPLARVERLEEELRKNSCNSSKPPSSDPPETRQERRAEAQAKAKELLWGERQAGGQPSHRGSVASSLQRISSMRSSTTSPSPAGAAGTASAPPSAAPPRASGDIRWPSCRRSRRGRPSTAPTACAAPECKARPRPSRPTGYGARPSDPCPSSDGDDERPQPRLAPRHGRALLRQLRIGYGAVTAQVPTATPNPSLVRRIAAPLGYVCGNPNSVL